MSSFKVTVKHKASGEMHDVWCLDDYFGKHKYGYVQNIPDGIALTEEQFYRLYEREEA